MNPIINGTSTTTPDGNGPTPVDPEQPPADEAAALLNRINNLSGEIATLAARRDELAAQYTALVGTPVPGSQ